MKGLKGCVCERELNKLMTDKISRIQAFKSLVQVGTKNAESSEYGRAAAKKEIRMQRSRVKWIALQGCLCVLLPGQAVWVQRVVWEIPKRSNRLESGFRASVPVCLPTKNSEQ